MLQVRKSLDEQQEKVLDSMDGLTAEQQEGVVLFWEEAYKFLCNVLNFLKEVFEKIIDMIGNGYQLVRDSVSALFNEIYGLINKVF